MIYVVVRRTTDWDDETTFRAQIPAGFAPAVALWDSTFAMPYRFFRRELKRIAELSVSRVAGAICVAREEIPEAAVVVPTDDDDWLAPRLAEILEARVDRRHVGYYWPSRFLEVPINFRHRLGRVRRAIFPRTRPQRLCTTNNYAVTMRPDVAALIDSHTAASRWFVAHPDAVQKIGDHLSAMNRTLASRTSFRTVRSQPALLRKFRRYQRLYRKPLAPELSWCKPYVAMMSALMDQLRVTR